MVFGQVVIGPPGSGKTTYCNGMSQFLSLLGGYIRPLCFGCPSQATLAKWKWNALGLGLLVTAYITCLETRCVIRLVTTEVNNSALLC